MSVRDDLASSALPVHCQCTASALFWAALLRLPRRVRERHAMKREEEASKLELQPQPPVGAAPAALANSGDACGAPLPPAAPAVATEEVPALPRVCACP